MAAMDRHPFLPPLNPTAGSFLFPEADDQGVKFVQVTSGRYAPLHSYQNSDASPFVSLACDCGALNPDATCVTRGSDLSRPFIFDATLGAQWNFKRPFEVLPPFR